MSDSIITGSPRYPDEELPGFFGAEPAWATESIDPEVWALIDEYLDRNAGGYERLIPLLHRVQQSIGYLPFPVQEYIADKIGLSPVQIHGVISFYHFFTTVPRGKHQLKVCMGTACFVRHAQRLLETIGQEIGIHVGEVTDDRLFSLEQVRCIGSCGLAPAMMHNDDTHGNLTPKNVRSFLRKLKSAARREKKPRSPEARSG